MTHRRADPGESVGLETLDSPLDQSPATAPIRDQVARELRVSGDVQFILRAGYLKRYPDAVSLRMPVPRFVTASHSDELG